MDCPSSTPNVLLLHKLGSTLKSHIMFALVHSAILQKRFCRLNFYGVLARVAIEKHVYQNQSP
jgi:hypothetical protein